MTNVVDQGMNVPSRKLSTRACLGATVMVFALAACVTDQAPSLPEPYRIEKKDQNSNAVELVQADLGATRDKFSTEPGLATPMGRTLAEPYSSAAPPPLKGDRISVNFEGLRLAAFANTVFGELLNVTFEIDNAVQQREQLVTLRTAEPLDPNQFLTIVRQVLGNYGISIIYQNNVYRIVESAAMRQDIPRIVRSRALPNVPNDMRPVFYYAALRAIPAGAMQSWLQQSLKDRLQYQVLPLLNGLLLLGKMEDIEAAKETIDILDQPALAGSKSMRVSPAFWSAERMATQLVEVLTAEGYSVGIGGGISTSIKIVPVKALNILIIFCADDTVMQHTLAWAADLDQPGQTIETKGIFYHPVYNTKAKDLAEIIETLLGGGPTSMAGGIRPTSANGMTSSAASPTNAQGTSTGTAEQRGTGEARKVIVDEGRNALIFQGTPEEYSQFRTLVDQMDRAPLEVLIEATVAEVTLKQGETLGAVLEFDDGLSAAVSRSAIKSTDGLLVSLIRDSGQFKANLKALADKSRVNILSNPRIVASSGKPASIQIGTQVPIITTQQTSPTGTVGGTSALLQDIQYRSTGVGLTINPTINSNRRVQLEVSQEVSEAQTNNVSNVQSPLILTRSIQTSLSITDGETVMLGGLISENVSKSENGIPILMDIPILGNIFKTTSRGRNRTELIILLTPYIIESAETARTLRDAFRERLTGLPSVQGVELNASPN